MSTVIPDLDHPEFSVFWLRDGCLACHPWLNELTFFNDTSLRPQVDDVVHALTRTQQVVSLAGNIFTGGIEEAVFDLHLNMILDPVTRIGSPAAGMSIFIFSFWIVFRAKGRYPSFPRGCPSQVRGVVNQARTGKRYLGR
jgi:hypothetical protein